MGTVGNQAVLWQFAGVFIDFERLEVGGVVRVKSAASSMPVFSLFVKMPAFCISALLTRLSANYDFGAGTFQMGSLAGAAHM